MGAGMNWYLEVLKKYAVFEGRARRKEYWMFTLFNILISFGLGMIDGLRAQSPNFSLGLLGTIYTLAVFIPAFTVSVRRLHDIGKSGWWLFIALIPIVGGIVLLVFSVTDSQPGENEYGPNPKERVEQM